MDQIICDICGCEYAQTSERCPICGYPRQGSEKNAVAAGAVERAKVKGGRFSSRNVKKRKKAERRAAAAQRERSDKPLLITIALLLAAIVLVSLYIAQRFIWSTDDAFGNDRGQKKPAATAADSTPAPTVPCAGILLEESVLTMDAQGQSIKIALTLMPEDTTDVLTFVSSDETVVQVGEDGIVTAVGPGQAQITVTCGSAEKVCTVVCWFGVETTAPAETTEPVETTAPPETTKPDEGNAAGTAGLTLDPADASCFSAGESFPIYVHLGSSSVSRSKVTWSTSDPRVATVNDGVVTAVGKGTATITAEYEGKKAVCMVRCRFEDPADQESPANQTWKASHSDVSISIGESFPLTVKNSDGQTADAIWTMSVDGVVSVEGKTVTGRNSGTVTLTTTVEGSTFTCIVRVR